MKKYSLVNALFRDGATDVLSSVKSLIDATVESETYDDVAPHRICEVSIDPGRTNMVLLALTAHDDAGAQIAFQIAAFTVTRFGSGPILVYGGGLPMPVGLNFAPAGPVWTADFVESSPGKLAIEVTDVGSPGVPIRWKATMLVLGTQVE